MRRCVHIELSLLIAVAFLVGSACAPKVNLNEPSPFDEDDPRAGHSQKFEAQASAPVTTGRSRGGDLERSALEAILDQGPGTFLRGVEITAQFHNDRFTGWKVVQFMPSEHRFDPYDLVPGDIVKTVNGHQISRPNHLHDLWEELRETSTIVVALERDGAPFELQFDVVD